MNAVPRMKIFHNFEKLYKYNTMIILCIIVIPYLVHDVLHVNWLEDFGFDNSMQISVHKLKDQVDILIITCSDYIQ